MQGRDRRALAQELAEPQGGVVSRAQLAEVGITRHDIRSEVRAERWLVLGSQTVGTSREPLERLAELARCWTAVWEAGIDIASVDGVTALRQAGLVGYEEQSVHLSVVHRHDTAPLQGARIQQGDPSSSR